MASLQEMLQCRAYEAGSAPAQLRAERQCKDTAAHTEILQGEVEFLHGGHLLAIGHFRQRRGTP